MRRPPDALQVRMLGACPFVWLDEPVAPPSPTCARSFALVATRRYGP